MRALGVVGAVGLLVAVAGAPPAAWSESQPEVALTLQDNRFTPEEIRVKAGAPFTIVLTNKDKGAEEFDSRDLRLEKVVPAGKTVRMRMPSLKPGTYHFVGEYHESTAKGRIVAE